MYGNEKETGAAVRDSGIKREEVYVTTKMLSPAGSEEETYARLKKSVETIGLGYVDLFLIHSSRQANGAADRKHLWSQLQKLQKAGLAKSIGVSNYGVNHLKEMDSPPAVNQIELHPFCQQRPVVEYCQKHGIIVEAYCPIMRGQHFDHPVIKGISEEHGVSPAQVLIRWSLQRGFVPLPKSDKPNRIESNADVYKFNLSKEQMDKLDSLDKGAAGAITPSNAAVEDGN